MAERLEGGNGHYCNQDVADCQAEWPENPGLPRSLADLGPVQGSVAAAAQSLLVEDICAKGVCSAVKLGWISDGFRNKVIPNSEAGAEGCSLLLWLRLSLSVTYIHYKEFPGKVIQH